MNRQSTNKSSLCSDSLAVFLLDWQCRITGLNKNAEMLTDQSFGDLFGRHMDDLLARTTRGKSLADLFAYLHRKE